MFSTPPPAYHYAGEYVFQRTAEVSARLPITQPRIYSGGWHSLAEIAAESSNSQNMVEADDSW